MLSMCAACKTPKNDWNWDKFAEIHFFMRQSSVFLHQWTVSGKLKPTKHMHPFAVFAPADVMAHSIFALVRLTCIRTYTYNRTEYIFCVQSIYHCLVVAFLRRWNIDGITIPLLVLFAICKKSHFNLIPVLSCVSCIPFHVMKVTRSPPCSLPFSTNLLQIPHQNKRVSFELSDEKVHSNICTSAYYHMLGWQVILERVPWELNESGRNSWAT